MPTFQEQAYQLGRHLAFEKLATSRWREAIRSGQASEDAANKMRQGMRYNPLKHDSDLLRGAKEWANRVGYNVITEPPKEVWGPMLRGKFAPARQKLFHMAASMTGGGLTLPPSREIYLGPRGYGQGLIAMHEAREAAKAKRITPKTGFTGWWDAIRHPARGYQIIPKGSAQEANAAKEYLYTGASPDETVRRLKQQGIPRSAHMDATLPINDIREMRLMGANAEQYAHMPGDFSGSTPREGATKLWGARQFTGEAQEAYEASRRVTGKPGYFPRKQVKRIGGEMERANMARITAPYQPNPSVQEFAGMAGYGMPGGSGLPHAFLPNPPQIGPVRPEPIYDSVPLYPKRTLRMGGLGGQRELFPSLASHVAPSVGAAEGLIPEAERGLRMLPGANRKLFPSKMDKFFEFVQKAKRGLHK